jgi:hypothetical protein
VVNDKKWSGMMKFIMTGLGLVMAGVSIMYPPIHAAVSMELGQDNDIQVSTSGKACVNRIEVSGDSIQLGNISSVVGGESSQSSIHIGSGQERRSTVHPSSTQCGDSLNGIRFDGEGQTAVFDGIRAEVMCISGKNNQISIGRVAGLNQISLFGTGNTIKINKRRVRLTLQLGGIENTVYIVRGAVVKVVRHGGKNDVIRF